MTDDVTQRGLEFFVETMGEARGAAMREAVDAGGFGGAMSKLALDYAFGSVWTRDGLERKQRSLVVIGILIAQRQIAELQNHIRIGLANGLTGREIEEALIQAIPYTGFPAVSSATGPVIAVLREHGISSSGETPQERGTL